MFGQLDYTFRRPTVSAEILQEEEDTLLRLLDARDGQAPFNNLFSEWREEGRTGSAFGETFVRLKRRGTVVLLDTLEVARVPVAAGNLR